eukprot:10233019-Ditylum_brightwellii.AAC.1
MSPIGEPIARLGAAVCTAQRQKPPEGIEGAPADASSCLAPPPPPNSGQERAPARARRDRHALPGVVTTTPQSGRG